MCVHCAKPVDLTHISTDLTKCAGLAAKFPTGTGIELMSVNYSLKANAQQNLNVIQFPLKLAYAVTAHKIQGQSLPKPLKIGMDLGSTFTPSQAYVMLSRVEDIKQVVIMQAFQESNVTISPEALTELKKMNERSENANPTPWRSRKAGTTKIACLNVMNLKNNHRFICQDPTLQHADILCFSETWVSNDDDEQRFAVEGYQAHFNSAGPGKGLAVFFKSGVFWHRADCSLGGAQLSWFESEALNVFAIYRSQRQDVQEILSRIDEWREDGKVTVVCGDLNLCAKKDPKNKFTAQLEEWGFEQLNKEATHIEGGHIDHVYLTKEAVSRGTLERYTPFYTDHDALFLTVKDVSEVNFAQVVFQVCPKLLSSHS